MKKYNGRCKRKTVSDSGSGAKKIAGTDGRIRYRRDTGGQCHCRAESGENGKTKNSWNVPGNNRMNIHIGFL